MRTGSVLLNFHEVQLVEKSPRYVKCIILYCDASFSYHFGQVFLLEQKFRQDDLRKPDLRKVPKLSVCLNHLD